MPRIVRYVTLIIGVLILTALGTYAVLGSFSRIIADDYCTAYQGLEYGVVDGIVRQYHEWSGAYSTFFMKYALAPLQPSIHPILPTLLIVGWFVALFVFFSPLAERVRLPHPQKGSAFLALIMTFVLVNSVPSLQNIYWYGATIPYVLPVILLVMYVGALLRYFRHPRTPQEDIIMAAVHAAIVLALCGFTEVSITFIVTLHGLGLLLIPVVPRTWRRGYIMIVGVGLVAGLIGLIFAVTAPGIAIRQERVNEVFDYQRVSLPRLAYTSLVFTGLFLIAETFGLAHMLFLFLTVFVGLIAYYGVYATDKPYALPKPTYIALFTLGSGILLIMSVVVPNIYALGFVASRTLVSARLVQMLMIVVWAYLTASAAIRRNWVVRLQRSPMFKPTLWSIIGMMAFLPLQTIGSNLIRYPEFETYARGWDARHEILSSADEGATIRIPDLEYDIADYLLLETITNDPNWVNNCATNFYQLEAIVVEEIATP
ncbi:MAG: hypothetical protein Q9P44_13130 [Anaerolineae bacterium]|nr:hypothetical protein [Anaerolineae bacterium]